MFDASIVITNYNYGKYLARCIRSCLNQKHINVEVILVDDNSEEDISKIVNNFSDYKNFKFIKNKNNLGVAGAANVGLASAKSMFVIRVDADDYINEDMCYFMRTYLIANKDAFCVSCDYNLVDNFGNLIERKHAESNPISCGIMYRKDLLLNLGGYNVNYRHREEEELRFRLGDNYKIHHLRIPFYRYRMHDHNKTKTKEYKETIVWILE